MYIKEDIGKISPVVSQSCNYKHTTAFGAWKKHLKKRIVVYCTHTNGDIGKLSPVVNKSGH